MTLILARCQGMTGQGRHVKCSLHALNKGVDIMHSPLAGILSYMAAGLAMLAHGRGLTVRVGNTGAGRARSLTCQRPYTQDTSLSAAASQHLA